MPSSHLILCRPLLLLPPIPPSMRVFTNKSTLYVRWPKYWSFSFSINPSNEHPGLISFRMDWLDLLAVQGTLKSLLQHHSSKASIFRHYWDIICMLRCFPGGSVVKNLPANVGLIPGSGRSLGGGTGYPLQSSCLGNPMNRGAWWGSGRVLQSMGSKRVRHDLGTKQFVCHRIYSFEASSLLVLGILTELCSSPLQILECFRRAHAWPGPSSPW